MVPREPSGLGELALFKDPSATGLMQLQNMNNSGVQGGTPEGTPNLLPLYNSNITYIVPIYLVAPK